MGVYLSEPITEKNVKEGTGKDFTYCMAEMQGTPLLTKDGARTWRMPLSFKWSWVTAILYSQFSTATGV